jgi:hypothetical protein
MEKVLGWLDMIIIICTLTYGGEELFGVLVCEAVRDAISSRGNSTGLWSSLWCHLLLGNPTVNLLVCEAVSDV